MLCYIMLFGFTCSGSVAGYLAVHAINQIFGVMRMCMQGLWIVVMMLVFVVGFVVMIVVTGSMFRATASTVTGSDDVATVATTVAVTDAGASVVVSMGQHMNRQCMIHAGTTTVTGSDAIATVATTVAVTDAGASVVEFMGYRGGTIHFAMATITITNAGTTTETVAVVGVVMYRG